MYNIEDSATGIGSDVKADLMVFEQNGKNAYPKLSVDHKNQLACTNIYGRGLFFLPLRRESTEISGHFIIDLSHLHVIGSIVDQCFVDGYGQLTVAVLLDTSNGVPIGHAMKLRHTYSLYVLAVDPSLKTAAMLWKADHLPNDSLKVYPVKSMNSASIPTILVISLNALLVVNKEKTTALSTNGFSAVSINTDVIELHPSELEIALELDSSHWVDMGMDDGTMIGTLKDGMVVKLVMSESRAFIKNLTDLS